MIRPARANPLTLILLAWALLACPAPAQTADGRAERYLDAYMMNNEAERLEKAGQLQEALRKFREASQIFDQIASNHPGWEANMIAMRRRKVADSIQRVQTSMISAPLQQPAAPGEPAASAAPEPPPSFQAPAFDSAPPSQAPVSAADAMAAPPSVGSWDSAPAAASDGPVPSLGDILRRYEDDMRSRLLDLQRKNLELEQAYRKWEEWHRWASGEIQTARNEKEQIALRAGQMEGRLQQLEREVSAGQATQDQLDMLLKEKAAMAALDRENERRLTAATQAAEDAAAKLAEAGAELEAVRAERDAAVVERDKLQTELAAATKARETLSAENQKLASQVSDLEKSKQTEALKKLTAENESLKAELQTARKQVATLTAEGERKDAEIAALKEEVGSIQTRLADLQKENTAFETQVSELTAQLKQLQGSMTETAGEDPVLASENEVLRGAILRQLRGQARQQQAKALLIQELRQLEGASETLLRQVQLLDESMLTLTEEEQALFTDPQVKELVSEGANPSVQATLMASGSRKDAGVSDPPAGEGALPATLAELLGQGNIALQARRYEEAAGHYQEVLRAEPRNVTALLGLGDALQRSSNYSEAEVALKKAIAYDPDNARAYFLLGLTQYRAGRLNEATASFEESLRKDARQALAHHYLGIISSNLKQAARAEKEFRTALAIDPNFGEAHFNLAVLYSGWNPPQWDKARSEYDSAVGKGVQPDPALETLLKRP
jgi:tetratricopeptide (TPR) repeat protein